MTYDHYSLQINGTRVFISSAEFHYQRLPIPELWLDILQKYKANGLPGLIIVRNDVAARVRANVISYLSNI